VRMPCASPAAMISSNRIFFAGETASFVIGLPNHFGLDRSYTETFCLATNVFAFVFPLASARSLILWASASFLTNDSPYANFPPLCCTLMLGSMVLS